MDGFDTSPIDPNDPRLARPLIPPATLPTAKGAPTQQEQPAGVLPRARAWDENLPNGQPAMLAGTGIKMPRAVSITAEEPAARSPQQTQGLAFPQAGVPGRTAADERLATLQEQGSRISRIHNPFLKGLATTGDILEGLFAPRAEQLTPGTEGNHALRLAQAQNAVKGEREVGNEQSEAALRGAEARHYNAEAAGLENPQGKPAANAVELFQKDPDAFAKYEQAVQKAAANHEPQMIKDGEGNIVGMIDAQLKFHSPSDPNLDPEAKAIMAAAKPKPPAPHIEKGEDGTIYGVDVDAATGKPTLTTLVEGKGKKPQLSAEERGYMKAAGGNPDDENTWSPQIMQKYANLKRDKTTEGEVGTWQLEEQNGKTVLFNSKTHEVRPAPEGLAKLGTAAKEQPAKDALAYAEEYSKSGQFTGAGDEALMDQFFQLAKPKRMNANQNKILMESRDLIQGAVARAKHLFTPNAPYFDDQQRQNIVKTMRDLAKSQGNAVENPGTSGGAVTHRYNPDTGKIEPINAR